MSSNAKYIECDCGAADHILIFDKDKEFESVYVYYRMSHYLGFWNRLRVALKYLFKLEDKNLATEEIILSKEKCKDIIDFLKDV